MERTNTKNVLICFLGLVAILFCVVNSLFFTKNILAFILPLIAAILLILICFGINKVFKDTEPKVSKNKLMQKLHVYFAKKDNKVSFIRQVLAVGFVLLLIFEYISGHDFYESIFGLTNSVMNPFETVISVLLNTYFIGSICFVAINEFIRSKGFNSIIKYIVTPISILSLVFFGLLLKGKCGDIVSNAVDYRGLLLAIELGLLIGFSCLSWIKDPHIKIRKGEGYFLIVGLVLLILCGLNCYLPSNLFGNIRNVPSPFDLNVTHRVLIGCAFILPILYFIILYRFDYAHRRAFLCYISLAVLFGYALLSKFDNKWDAIYKMPLHLCNTAMYVVPLTLIFKSHGLFYFTMFINVIGAALALLMPNYSSLINFFDPRVVEFYLNHFYAFFMPVLIIMLGIYERPKLKYFFYSMIGFLIYYVLILSVNVYYSGIGHPVDFFFINSNFVADKLGKWANDLFDINVTFTVNGDTFTFRPPYQIAFYLVYVVLAFGMWYIYEVLFKGVDVLLDLVERNKVYKEKELAFIKLEKERGIDMKNKQKIDLNSLKSSVVIKNLTKRYGNNTSNAVTDFNLTLKEGKIYGFLGKNGAGKSTIIKSIVGMHTFNSGSIEVCGFDVENQPIEAKSCIGFVPDHYALYENLTGRQYINYISDLYDVSEEDRESTLNSLCEKLDMTDHIDHQIKTYSHGMKQKITIIGALIHNPKIWILDEPMTGVDPNSIFQIKECMREHARKGNIVFFSSHLIDVVSNLCDDIIIIKQGQFIMETSLKDLRDNNINLEELFLEKTADSEEEVKKIIKEEKASK